MNRLFVFFMLAAIALGAPALARAQVAASPGLSASVPATPSPAPKSKATPAPPKDTTPKRVGISGVWEIQIQRATGVTYTHFKLDQKDNVLTGEYLDTNGKRYPLFGSVDGKNVRVVVSLPSGGTLVFTGTEDSLTDMIGMLALNGDSVIFTAAYRPKYNWLDNLTPGTGGMGTPY